MSATPCIRSAFWTGSIKPGAETLFADGINHTLVPLLNKLPGVHHARALWPTKLEDNPPAVVCQVLVEFASRDDLAVMLASTERQAMRSQVKELIGHLDGHISHIEYDVA